tara:strand:+ start:2880 stop:3377 length:498 start_codon:yes stop_codon:yes gene_type:complete
MAFQRKKCILLRQTLGDIMKWEDILKISAGERSDAERFADPKDMLMNDSVMRKVLLSRRKILNSLRNRPKKIVETLKRGRHPNPLVDEFLEREAKVIKNMNLDFLDKKLKNMEDELNKDSPSAFKLKRMDKSYDAAFKDAFKPLRELRQERAYRLEGREPVSRKR